MAARSVRERAEMCWQGRHDIVAVMECDVSLTVEVIEDRGESEEGLSRVGLGVRVKST